MLASPILSKADAEVLAGHKRLDDTVRWVHPTEVADIAHLLRGGEIIMTAGMLLPEDRPGIEQYVNSLARANVVGVVVELGRRWSAAVPESLVETCRAMELVLVVLHREVRFAAVVEEVGAMILATEVQDLRVCKEIHESFTRLDVSAAGADELLATVVQFAGVPAVLESYRHQVMRFDTASREPTEVLSDWARRSRGVTLRGRTGYDRHSGWLMGIVGSRGDDWGRLIIMTDSKPVRRDYVLIERAAAALALCQMRAGARDSVERDAHTALIARLRSGEISPALTTHCEAAHLPVESRTFFAFAVRSRLNIESGKQLSLNELAATVARAGRTSGLDMLVGVEKDHVITLVSIPQAMEVDSALGKLAENLRQLADVTIARGEIVFRVEEAFRSLVEAKNILAVSDGDDPRPWITLADVHLRGFVQMLRDDERLSLFVRREVGLLLAHDDEHGTSFVAILQGYLETPGGKAAAAKRLLLSRQVLYERLSKIEQILGVDLEDPHIRTSLHVALVAKSLIAAEELLVGTQPVRRGA